MIMTSSVGDQTRDEGKGRDRPPSGDVHILCSRELFAGRSEICIEHEGSLYRLKLTRQGKLILNK